MKRKGKRVSRTGIDSSEGGLPALLKQEGLSVVRLPPRGRFGLLRE